MNDNNYHYHYNGELLIAQPINRQNLGKMSDQKQQFHDEDTQKRRLLPI